MDINRLQQSYDSEALYGNFVSYTVSYSSERINICSRMAGNASSFCFAIRVRFVFSDAIA